MSPFLLSLRKLDKNLTLLLRRTRLGKTLSKSKRRTDLGMLVVLSRFHASVTFIFNQDVIENKKVPDVIWGLILYHFDRTPEGFGITRQNSAAVSCSPYVYWLGRTTQHITITMHPYTTHATTHARPSLAVIPDPNPAPPNW